MCCIVICNENLWRDIYQVYYYFRFPIIFRHCCKCHDHGWTEVSHWKNINYVILDRRNIEYFYQIAVYFFAIIVMILSRKLYNLMVCITPYNLFHCSDTRCIRTDTYNVGTIVNPENMIITQQILLLSMWNRKSKFKQFILWTICVLTIFYL